MKIDLNSDMGEGFGAWRMGDDAAMLAIVTSANIACGWHAGDPLIMFQTAEIALKNGVAIGAHPGFGDLWGFGRRRILGDSLSDLEKQIAYQIGAMQALATLAGHKVTHVKVHGALGNMINDDDDMAMAVGKAVRGVDRSLIYVVMPGRPTERAAERLGLRAAREVFADRAYRDDGNLVGRTQEGAVIHDSALAAARVLRMVEDKRIVAASGDVIPVEIDTICVHGDNPAAVEMARSVRQTLEGAGVILRPFHLD